MSQHKDLRILHLIPIEEASFALGLNSYTCVTGHMEFTPDVGRGQPNKIHNIATAKKMQVKSPSTHKIIKKKNLILSARQ